MLAQAENLTTVAPKFMQTIRLVLYWIVVGLEKTGHAVLIPRFNARRSLSTNCVREADVVGQPCSPTRTNPFALLCPPNDQGPPPQAGVARCKSATVESRNPLASPGRSGCRETLAIIHRILCRRASRERETAVQGVQLGHCRAMSVIRKLRTMRPGPSIAVYAALGDPRADLCFQ